MKKPNQLILRYFERAQDFLKQARSFLEENEAVYGLMLGLAERAALNDTPIKAWIVSKNHASQFLVFQTPPNNLILTESPDLSSPSFAAREIARAMPDLIFPGVVGPVHECDAFREAWEEKTSAKFRVGFRQRLHKASEVFLPNVAGQFRQARIEDLDLVLKWSYEFAAEALPNEVHSIERLREDTKARLSIGGVWLWCVEGKPVAQAAVSRPTKKSISLNLVYTPPEFRGFGYASAVVGALTDLQLRSGKEFCVLYTDLSNPTSNSIYRMLGYRGVGDSIHWVRGQIDGSVPSPPI